MAEELEASRPAPKAASAQVTLDVPKSIVKTYDETKRGLVQGDDSVIDSKLDCTRREANNSQLLEKVRRSKDGWNVEPKPGASTDVSQQNPLKFN